MTVKARLLSSLALLNLCHAALLPCKACALLSCACALYPSMGVQSSRARSVLSSLLLMLNS